MRLLVRSKTGEFSLTKALVGDDPIPPYAILSHRWLADTKEPTFDREKCGNGCTGQCCVWLCADDW